MEALGITHLLDEAAWQAIPGTASIQVSGFRLRLGIILPMINRMRHLILVPGESPVRIFQLVLGWFHRGPMALSLSGNLGQHVRMRRRDIEPLSRVVPQVI